MPLSGLCLFCVVNVNAVIIIDHHNVDFGIIAITQWCSFGFRTPNGYSLLIDMSAL